MTRRRISWIGVLVVDNVFVDQPLDDEEQADLMGAIAHATDYAEGFLKQRPVVVTECSRGQLWYLVDLPDTAAGRRDADTVAELLFNELLDYDIESQLLTGRELPFAHLPCVSTVEMPAALGTVERKRLADLRKHFDLWRRM